MIYPTPCCRCGFCCLSAICPAAQELGHHKPPCPLLSFDENGQASCQIVTEYPQLTEIMGIGKGCCIKARAYRNGVKYDYASLPASEKLAFVSNLRKVRILT